MTQAPTWADAGTTRSTRVQVFLRTSGERREPVITILGRWCDLAADCMKFLRSDVAFTLVTIPEALAVWQIDGVLEELRRYELAISWPIASNVVQVTDSPFLAQKRERQQRHLERLRARHADVPIVETPLFPQEIRGAACLREIGCVLHPVPGDAGDPAALIDSGRMGETSGTSTQGGA